jgi:hypothetical protein
MIPAEAIRAAIREGSITPCLHSDHCGCQARSEWEAAVSAVYDQERAVESVSREALGTLPLN